MNPKFLLFLSLFTAVTLTASLAVGAPRGGGGGHFSSMRGGHTFTRGGTGTWGGRQWSGGNWSGDWRHHHHRFSNDVIFIGDFGFPFWWGWGYPYGYYGYGYPYDYYGYGYGDDGYGYDYGRYGYGSRSRVAELQRRLARAGYYRGAVDGIMGPETRRAIRAYERSHNQREYGMR